MFLVFQANWLYYAVAIIHYAPDPHDSAIIKQDQIYLCDSGGQYLDGTTDVTRTWVSYPALTSH
jgi:Xaa-Pro aminopeptidase